MASMGCVFATNFLHVAPKNGKKWLKMARKNLRCNYLLASFFDFPSLHNFSHR